MTVLKIHRKKIHVSRSSEFCQGYFLKMNKNRATVFFRDSQLLGLYDDTK
jgi:hypothetical protein